MLCIFSIFVRHCFCARNVNYVNGSLVGSTAANLYWGSAPDCGDTGPISITKDLGSSKSLTESYVVKDQTGWTYWSGTVNYAAGKCYATELLW
jgi:hypothetical protein